MLEPKLLRIQFYSIYCSIVDISYESISNLYFYYMYKNNLWAR